MAQDGPGTTGKDCGHPPSLPAQAGVAARVDPPMNTVETTGLQSTPPTPVPDPDLLQLSDRDHPVLAGRKARDEGIRRVIGDFPSHVGR